MYAYYICMWFIPIGTTNKRRTNHLHLFPTRRTPRNFYCVYYTKPIGEFFSVIIFRLWFTGIVYMYVCMYVCTRQVSGLRKQPNPSEVDFEKIFTSKNHILNFC